MYRVDRFVDTAEKRNCFFYLLLFGCMIWLLVIQILLGFALFSIKGQEELFALLSNQVLSYAYLARVVMQFLSLGSLSFWKILGILVFSTSFYEIVLAALLIIGLFPSPLKGCRKGLLWILGIMGVMLIGFGAFAAQALQMVTLQTSIHLLQMMGVVLMIGSFVCLLIAVSVIYHIVLIDYPSALQVEVEIIS